jgi:phospholipid-translocating ATPase
LKGSILKNTMHIVGFVVYTGNETRLMMNSKKGAFKLSKLEGKVNNLVMFILAFQLSLCVIVALIGIQWYVDSY